MKSLVLLTVIILINSVFRSSFTGILVYAASSKDVVNIGIIIDVDSRIGKEEKTAMEIAVKDFNSNSKNHNVSLHFQPSSDDPLQAVDAAKELINEKKVKIIIGMNTWEEVPLVADIGAQVQVPIVSLVAPAKEPPLASIRWPFLITMANDDTEQIKCIASIVDLYGWKRIIVVYEDSHHGFEFGSLTLLSNSLQEFGSEIEYHLVLPPFSLLSNPERIIQEQLVKIQATVQSRVFVVLDLSLIMASRFFRAANEMGLIGRDSVWIAGDRVADLFDSFHDSVISLMEGTLGIRKYYPTSKSYEDFASTFRGNFRAEHEDEDWFQPGIHALRAYDSISFATQAIERMGKKANISSPNLWIDSMLQSNFTGLSGKIHFGSNRLLQAPIMRVVTVIGKRYKELDFWVPNYGFSKTLNTMRVDGSFSGPVIWPGELVERQPKGWALPSVTRPLRIVVPKRTSFEKFVTFYDGKEKPDGFCIDLFYKVIEKLNYSLPYEFYSHDGSYDDMIYSVYIKKYDAAIGDVTILAERSKYVDFTQPYLESGLSIIVPKTPHDSAWIFIKPFSFKMWIVTAAIFVYTTMIIWGMEHKSNPEFSGPLKEQIKTAFWFTFSSLFFSHREKIKSNLSKVVVVVWLCLVFIITSSYTASLTSMLTIQRMEPEFPDITYLIKNKLNVGFDNDSFVQHYLQMVLGFKRQNLKILNSEFSYAVEFERQNLAAAFLELPYEKVFLNEYCKNFATTRANYRFGGFGFAFQKGSPIAADFSKAILILSEDGTLKSLEEQWFAPSKECSTDTTDNSVESLTLHSFFGLYIISITTSTFCVLLFLFHKLRHRRQQEPNQCNISSKHEGSVWNNAAYLLRSYSTVPRRASTFFQVRDVDEWSSYRWNQVNTSDTLEKHCEESSSTKIEMPTSKIRLESERKYLD